MSPRSSTISPASAAESAEDRVAVYNWQALAGELSDYGCAVLLNLLSADECRGIVGLYSDESHFRSHVHMARHGFGKGEYRYFKYPLPQADRRLTNGAISAPRHHRQRMERTDGNSGALSRHPRLVSQAMSRRGPGAPNAAAAAVCSG